MNTQSISKTQTYNHSDDSLSSLTASPHEVGLSAERLERISSITQGFINEGQLAGAVTVVARRGKVAHFEAYGMMDLEADKPIQKDTIFRIYSMTKPIAAVGVMILCEEGKLTLDAPASTYLPELSGMQVAGDADANVFMPVEANREMTVQEPNATHRRIARRCPLHERQYRSR